MAKKAGELWFEHGEPPMRHRIVCIEYLDGQPGNAITEKHWDHTREPWFKPRRDKPTGTCGQYWDFEFCKRHGELYYYNSGMGGDYLTHSVGQMVKPDPPALIWCADDMVFTRWESHERPAVKIRSEAVLLKRGFKRITRPLMLKGNFARSRNPFKVATETFAGFAYCKICNDHFPDDMECEHLEWCDDCGSLVYVDTHVREDEPDGKPVVHRRKKGG